MCETQYAPTVHELLHKVSAMHIPVILTFGFQNLLKHRTSYVVPMVKFGKKSINVKREVLLGLDSSFAIQYGTYSPCLECAKINWKQNILFYSNVLIGRSHTIPRPILSIILHIPLTEALT